MGTVVITGSTKGIGRGLAEEFIKRGHNAVISSRNPADVEKVSRALAAIGPGKCSGITCDITDKSQLQTLWAHAVNEFGQVDFWVNNAGMASSRHAIHELPEDITRTLINGNMLGTTFGSQVAMTGFREQGHGALYNILGGSFDGKRLVPNMGVYSSTKAGIHLLTRYLVEENKNQTIVIGMISPGMLITENWFDEQKKLSDREWQKIKPLLNVLCDYVETVTPWLTDEIIANTESGKRIAWMSTGKMMKRFFAAKVLGRKRDLFSRFGL
ncbi:MAG: SDR family oxidoreductase [Gammaproteobacteria bacterium]|nr:SDR family oxidoreductase [Gammaproteobacteria bacterium]MCP4090703.1 SDR family oxidoreductase [Gammaproteobacteria bacterium]MCP4277130.1 SDR family oxidoreductase [Gammaproteobacteria bacterium]MCP4832686.1 SDR family oxidoreductase [Gammaproteobacteria bacterium]MCP4928060.1 SDR family oxidoreductase [Gammaproteobacteria bacterium]